jgi:hypothetical protein
MEIVGGKYVIYNGLLMLLDEYNEMMASKSVKATVAPKTVATARAPIAAVSYVPLPIATPIATVTRLASIRQDNKNKYERESDSDSEEFDDVDIEFDIQEEVKKINLVHAKKPIVVKDNDLEEMFTNYENQLKAEEKKKKVSNKDSINNQDYSKNEMDEYLKSLELEETQKKSINTRAQYQSDSTPLLEIVDKKDDDYMLVCGDSLHKSMPRFMTGGAIVFNVSKGVICTLRNACFIISIVDCLYEASRIRSGGEGRPLARTLDSKYTGNNEIRKTSAYQKMFVDYLRACYAVSTKYSQLSNGFIQFLNLLTNDPSKIAFKNNVPNTNFGIDCFTEFNIHYGNIYHKVLTTMAPDVDIIIAPFIPNGTQIDIELKHQKANVHVENILSYIYYLQVKKIGFGLRDKKTGRSLLRGYIMSTPGHFETIGVSFGKTGAETTFVHQLCSKFDEIIDQL